MSNYTAWYRTGTATVTKNSTTVTGSNTYWASAGLHPGDIFTIDAHYIYEIESVVDNTHLTLKTAYTGNTVSGLYAIIRNFTSHSQADIAARTVEILNDIRKYIDQDMQNIHGKSAYEIACDNGYVGTEQQWLQSLIGSGEWVSLRDSVNTAISGFTTRVTQAESIVNGYDDRTKILAYGEQYQRAAFRNSIPSGKSLGSVFTDEQKAAISSGSFSGIHLGDYWTFSGVEYSYTDEDGETQNTTYSGTMRIMHFNYFGGSTPHLLIMPDGALYNEKFSDDLETNPVTSTGYATSYIRTYGLLRATAIFEACFGADHLHSYTDYLVGGLDVNAHTISNVSQTTHGTTCKVELPTLMMLRGNDIACTDYRNHTKVGANRMHSDKQLAFLRYAPYYGGNTRTRNFFYNNDGFNSTGIWNISMFNNEAGGTYPTSKFNIRPYCCVK